MGERLRVLVTGADGVVGGIIRSHLGQRYALTHLTRRPAAFASHVADLADLDAIRPAFDGVDAVIHLAGSSAVDASWKDVLTNNMVGTRNVFEAARRAKVPRVVFASSNHVIGMYEVEGAPGLYRLSDRRTYDATVPVRPDSLYGASKAFGEALGRMYADLHGISVICLRIGSVRRSAEYRHRGRRVTGPELNRDDTPDRLRATWLSFRDCAELVRCAVETKVGWAVVYGTSDNPRQIWDLRGALDLLGYQPMDRAPVELQDLLEDRVTT